MTQTEVTAILSTPDDISCEKPPCVFKYGSIALHFDEQDYHGLYLVCDTAGQLNIQFEAALYNALAIVSRNLTDSNAVYCQLFDQGHQLLSSYKAGGGTQPNAYNTVMHLYMDNRRNGGELEGYREDLIGDWLDCLCSWICNEEAVIW